MPRSIRRQPEMRVVTSRFWTRLDDQSECRHVLYLNPCGVTTGAMTSLVAYRGLYRAIEYPRASRNFTLRSTPRASRIKFDSDREVQLYTTYVRFYHCKLTLILIYFSLFFFSLIFRTKKQVKSTLKLLIYIDRNRYYYGCIFVFLYWDNKNRKYRNLFSKIIESIQKIII